MTDWVLLTKPNGDDVLVNLSAATDIERLTDKSRIHFGQHRSVEVTQGIAALFGLAKEPKQADRI